MNLRCFSLGAMIWLGGLVLLSADTFGLTLYRSKEAEGITWFHAGVKIGISNPATLSQSEASVALVIPPDGRAVEGALLRRGSTYFFNIFPPVETAAGFNGRWRVRINDGALPKEDLFFDLEGITVDDFEPFPAQPILNHEGSSELVFVPAAVGPSSVGVNGFLSSESTEEGTIFRFPPEGLFSIRRTTFNELENEVELIQSDQIPLVSANVLSTNSETLLRFRLPLVDRGMESLSIDLTARETRIGLHGLLIGREYELYSSPTMSNWKTEASFEALTNELELRLIPSDPKLFLRLEGRDVGP